MLFSTLLAQSVLYSLTFSLAFAAPTTSSQQQPKPKQTPAISNFFDLLVTSAPGQRGKIYHWEIDSIPATLPKLTKPLHLLEPLQPGKSAFDIAQDPIGSGSLVKRKESTSLDVLGSLFKRKPSQKRERILRSLYPKRSYARSKDVHSAFIATPLPVQAFGGSQSRYIRLEYQMLFQPGFKWVKGGKLPGILAGSEKGCNAGCSGGGSAENCFSTRMMWRANGEGEMYLYAAKSVYFPKEKPETCRRSLDNRSPEALFARMSTAEDYHAWLDAYRLPTDEEGDEAITDELDDESSSSSSTIAKRATMDGSCLKGMEVTISPGAKNICNPTYGISIGRGGAFKFRSGTWHNVTQLIKVNSKGNAVRDGYLAVYLDNKVVVKAENIVLLKNGYDPAKGDSEANQVKFMFSSFFGGGTSDYATPVDQWIGWKGFKMSSSPVNIWE
ncbi:hypothetical protein BGZ94_008282 [Podila epigama]|nr:hypothetical protein BGZ94_008282 [Podila epigama]